MKKISFIFGRFQTKVILLLILSISFTGVMIDGIIYKFSSDAQFSQLQDKLKIIARTAALNIDADTLMKVPLNREGINATQYEIIADKLRKIQGKNPVIRFIYTMTKTDKPGIWQFIVDTEPVSKKKESVTSYPGDKYDASRFPEMLQAFNGPSVDKKPESDEWGVTLSGYAPIINSEGKAVAILGVDMLASDVYKIQKAVYMRAIFVLIFGIILSLVLGILLSRRITEPIKELVKGTRHISMGDLGYKVPVKGDDEISELASSFNLMARQLDESKRKNYSYFYDVIQTLARIVEAKDHYTRGHSDRVAEYSAKIAEKLKISKKEIDILKEAAKLHDIGKIGIHDNILNKESLLTEEEWKMIRQHPAIGEDILKPIALNPLMLEIVRAHHERYDGKGYPNNLKADEINIFAQILSVADAYDAMTSSRAYRLPLSKEKAIDELNKNKNIQFNPLLVDIFVKILKYEDV